MVCRGEAVWTNITGQSALEQEQTQRPDLRFTLILFGADWIKAQCPAEGLEGIERLIEMRVELLQPIR